MTKEELRKILASKENKLAGKAIEHIKTDGGDLPPDEALAVLKNLVKEGASDVFYQRDPAHPRSKYKTSFVLDACFDCTFGVTKLPQENTEEGNQTQTQTVILGPVYTSLDKKKVLFFEYLISQKFKPGDTSYRGNLYQHILNSCFYYSANDQEKEKKELARQLAAVVVARGNYNINTYANNNYHWVSDLGSLDFILSLGANPQENKMIDCAISYVACGPTFGERDGQRIHVIKKLLELGAKPKRSIDSMVSSQSILAKLQEEGLLEEIKKHIDNSIVEPQPTTHLESHIEVV
jgi:hypothetical protein